ncbi:MAG: hypothetical protein ACR2PT_15265 [Endozoicomonas sp.]
MSYPSAPREVDTVADSSHCPFEVPVEIALHGLRLLAREPQYQPLQVLLEKDIADLEQLLSMVAELENQALSAIVSEEIDQIIDDYRRSVAMA